MRKAVIALAGLAVLGWLFWQTVQSSLTEAYAVDAGLASEWNLALRDRPERGAGLLVLEASDQLRAELFQQIFARTMESFMSPVVATVPLVLHAEYRESLGTALSPQDLLQVAEESGLSDIVPTPVCIGVVRREWPEARASSTTRSSRHPRSTASARRWRAGTPRPAGRRRSSRTGSRWSCRWPDPTEISRAGGRSTSAPPPTAKRRLSCSSGTRPPN